MTSDRFSFFKIKYLDEIDKLLKRIRVASKQSSRISTTSFYDIIIIFSLIPTIVLMSYILLRVPHTESCFSFGGYESHLLDVIHITIIIFEIIIGIGVFLLERATERGYLELIFEEPSMFWIRDINSYNKIEPIYRNSRRYLIHPRTDAYLTVRVSIALSIILILIYLLFYSIILYSHIVINLSLLLAEAIALAIPSLIITFDLIHPISSRIYFQIKKISSINLNNGTSGKRDLSLLFTAFITIYVFLIFLSIISLLYVVLFNKFYYVKLFIIKYILMLIVISIGMLQIIIYKPSSAKRIPILKHILNRLSNTDIISFYKNYILNLVEYMPSSRESSNHSKSENLINELLTEISITMYIIILLEISQIARSDPRLASDEIIEPRTILDLIKYLEHEIQSLQSLSYVDLVLLLEVSLLVTYKYYYKSNKTGPWDYSQLDIILVIIYNIYKKLLDSVDDEEFTTVIKLFVSLILPYIPFPQRPA